MKKTFWGDYNQTTFPRLEKNIETKYLIIGGGIAGLSAAYFLLERGENDITLVESYTIGSGSTGHSAGMLVCEPEAASWTRISRIYGNKAARDYYEAQVQATHTINSIIKKGSIECDYRPHHLVMVGGDKRAKRHILEDFVTRKKIGAKAKMLDLEKTKLLKKDFTTGERLPHNISVNPLLFARGFALYLKNRGVKIYEHSSVTNLSQRHAETTNGSIDFDTLIECRGVRDSKIHIDNFLTTIAITNKMTPKQLEKLSLQNKDMFIDDEKRSFHYGKITGDNRLLVGYGDVLKKDTQSEDPVHIPHKTNIENFLKKTFAGIDLKIANVWSHRYALGKTVLPYVHVSKKRAAINGAGTQIASMVAADYVVSQLMGDQHSLKKILGSKKKTYLD